MLEFKTIEELKPNIKLLELIEYFNYKTKKGKIKSRWFITLNHRSFTIQHYYYYHLI